MRGLLLWEPGMQETFDARYEVEEKLLSVQDGQLSSDNDD